MVLREYENNVWTRVSLTSEAQNQYFVSDSDYPLDMPLRTDEGLNLKHEKDSERVHREIKPSAFCATASIRVYPSNDTEFLKIVRTFTPSC